MASGCWLAYTFTSLNSINIGVDTDASDYVVVKYDMSSCAFMPCTCSHPGSFMDADDCPFSRLPQGLRDAFLTQAFKQLDQHHCMCRVPLVCNPWQKLSLGSCSSIKAPVCSATSAKQLNAWLQRNSSKLDRVDVHIPVRKVSANFTHGICDALSKTLALRSLSLAPYANYNRHNLSAVLSPLTTLTSLSLYNWHVSGADTAAMVALTQLRSLKLEGISGHHARSDQFVTTIASSLKQLTSLEISGWTCSSDLRPLTALSYLQELHLKGTPRHYHVLSQLQSFPLRSVCIDVCVFSASPVAFWIQSCASRLVSLGIRNSRGSYFSPPAPAQMSELLKTLSRCASLQLQHFELWGCSTDQEAVAHLQPLTQLTKLVLRECSLNDLAVRQLAPLSNLQQLELWGNDAVTGADASMSSLASCLPHLTSLMVAKNGSIAVKEAFGGRIVKHIYGMGYYLVEIALPGGKAGARGRVGAA